MPSPTLFVHICKYGVGVGFPHDPILHLTTANAEPPLEGKPLFDKTSKNLVGRELAPATKFCSKAPPSVI